MLAKSFQLQFVKRDLFSIRNCLVTRSDLLRGRLSNTTTLFITSPRSLTTVMNLSVDQSWALRICTASLHQRLNRPWIRGLTIQGIFSQNRGYLR